MHGHFLQWGSGLQEDRLNGSKPEFDSQAGTNINNLIDNPMEIKPLKYLLTNNVRLYYNNTTMVFSAQFLGDNVQVIASLNCSTTYGKKWITNNYSNRRVKIVVKSNQLYVQDTILYDVEVKQLSSKSILKVVANFQKISEKQLIVQLNFT